MNNIDPRSVALGLEIRAEAAARRVTIKDLCDAAAVNRSTLYNYLGGERDMPLGVLMALSDALRVAPHDLLDRAEDRARTDARLIG